MSGSEQSSQEGIDFESAISSGSVSEGSSEFEPSVTDSGSSYKSAE